MSNRGCISFEPSPLVSLIIPMFNAEATIAGTLASAQNQTYRNLEIIVVDDGSSDLSPSIVAKMASVDPRISLTRIENSGVGVARNKGIDSASGNWLMFLDADDKLPENAVETLMNHRRGFSVVKGAFFILDAAVTPTSNGRDYSLDAHDACCLALAFWDNRSLAPSSRFSTGVVFRSVWGCIIDKTLINAHGIEFDENVKFGEDALFMVKTYHAAKRIAVVDSLVYLYSSNPRSVTHTITLATIHEVGETLDALHECSKTYPCCEELLKESGIREVLTLLGRISTNPNDDFFLQAATLFRRESFEWALSARRHRYSRGFAGEIRNQTVLALIKRGRYRQAILLTGLFRRLSLTGRRLIQTKKIGM